MRGMRLSGGLWIFLSDAMQRGMTSRNFVLPLETVLRKGVVAVGLEVFAVDVLTPGDHGAPNYHHTWTCRMRIVMKIDKYLFKVIYKINNFVFVCLFTISIMIMRC